MHLLLQNKTKTKQGITFKQKKKRTCKHSVQFNNNQRDELLTFHTPRPTRPFSPHPRKRAAVRPPIRGASRPPMTRAHLPAAAAGAAQRRPTVALLLGLALAFCLAVLSIQSSFFAAPGTTASSVPHSQTLPSSSWADEFALGLSRRGAEQEAGSGRRRRARARGVPVPRPAVRGKSPRSLGASARNHNRFSFSRDKNPFVSHLCCDAIS